MTKKQGRLRAIGRWGVWLCTAVLIAMLGIMQLLDVHVLIFHSKAGQGTSFGFTRLTFETTRLVVELTDRDMGVPIGHGWSVELDTWAADISDGVGWSRDSWWWKRPFRFAYGNGTVIQGQGVDLPLVYPAVVLVAWSVWLAWSRHALRLRLRIGCCVGCGYSLEGLGDGVCPECGAGSGG